MVSWSIAGVDDGVLGVSKKGSLGARGRFASDGNGTDLLSEEDSGTDLDRECILSRFENRWLDVAEAIRVAGTSSNARTYTYLFSQKANHHWRK